METKPLNIDFGIQEFQIGNKVSIDWKRKDDEGKSIRRKVIDAIMEEWRNIRIFNLHNDLEERYYFDSSKETIKIFSDIINKKRICEPSIFKHHQDSKGYFKNMVEALDNIQGAVVIGVQAQFHHTSKISPNNVCYVKANGQFSSKPLYIYTVMLHGLCDLKDKQNHVQFQIELFDEDMELIK